MVITRQSAPPHRWTFTIQPIQALLARYVGSGAGWIDPFAGRHSPAEWTNDHNPQLPTRYHLDAEAFCRQLPGPFQGVLFDPPYSYRQISEHYRLLGRKATALDTSTRFYNKVMNAICDKIVPGGYAISCGWNSNGFGPHRGFAIVEVLVVAHGQHHNDTLVTVERKTRAIGATPGRQSKSETEQWLPDEACGCEVEARDRRPGSSCRIPTVTARPAGRRRPTAQPLPRRVP